MPNSQNNPAPQHNQNGEKVTFFVKSVVAILISLTVASITASVSLFFRSASNEAEQRVKMQTMQRDLDEIKNILADHRNIYANKNDIDGRFRLIEADVDSTEAAIISRITNNMERVLDLFSRNSDKLSQMEQTVRNMTQRENDIENRLQDLEYQARYGMRPENPSSPATPPFRQ